MVRRQTPPRPAIMSPPVFVFGSNLAGRHGAGSALYAREYRGAVYGQGEGRQGNSYAIPTKDANLGTLPLEAIAAHVRTFLLYAAAHAHERFEVVPIGCGLAGYSPFQIAPMFRDRPPNVDLPREFIRALNLTPRTTPEQAACNHEWQTHAPWGQYADTVCKKCGLQQL